jgi:hypothetical protein
MVIEGGTSDAFVGAGGFPDDVVTIEPVTECPHDPPLDPTQPCKEGLHCTYGDDIRVGCRQSYQCSGGTWSASSGVCNPDIPQCSVQGVPLIGTACNDVGAWCVKDNGEICGCVECTFATCGVPLLQAWQCQQFASDGCPDVPPNRGQACSANMAACTYGFCPLEVHVEAQCVEGHWDYADVACAVSAP